VARLARVPEVEALIDLYRGGLFAAGHFAENEVTSPARAFLLRIGGPSGWSRLSPEQQREIRESRASALVMWMITAGHVRATPEFLADSYQPLGKVAAWVHPAFHQRFMQIAADVGFTPKVAELQWWAVAKVAAGAGVAPDKLTRTRFDAASRELIAAVETHGARSGRITLSTRLYGAEATLYHAGVIDGTPRKRAANQAILPTRMGELARQARGDLAGVRRADACHAAPGLDAAPRADTARVRALAAGPRARGHRGPGSPPRAHRALQTACRRETQPPRRATVQTLSRGRALDVANLPGTSGRVGRRGRADAEADVPR
jgi:hypothetical protein